MNSTLPPAFAQVPALPSYPVLPAVLYQGQGSWQQLLDAMMDPNYDHWSLIVYRYPTTSTDMEIVVQKQGVYWQYQLWRANLQYRPNSRTTSAYEVLQSIWSFVVAENIYPRLIEIVGPERSPNRIWMKLMD